MIKKVLFIAISVFTISLYGQKNNETIQETYKIAATKGKLQIDLGKATIEGYDGKEIIFSYNKGKKQIDERAKGLRSINALGLEDNTGFGINVVEKNGVIEVKQLRRIDSPDIKILVPKGIAIKFNHESQFGDNIIFKNIDNEIEVSTKYNNLIFENITGPATINSIYGSIDAKFSEKIKSPLSVVSIYGKVDISVPKNANADLKITTKYGEILVDPKLPLKMESNDGMIKYNEQLNAKLNNGGNNFNFRSDFETVYLRAL